MNQSGAGIYTAGGTVQAGGGIYIPRKADKELLDLCRRRVFAYVLTSRQMGKSSLMVQTATQLRAEDIDTVIIDLTEIGTQLTAEQWYLGLLLEISDQLDLEADPIVWWEEHSHLGFAQRLTHFFTKIVIIEIDAPIVVFIDEIDTTLSLGFTDDFFAAIRAFYNARAKNPDLERLSFVLFGVAKPTDLIRDSQRTPFNIGQALRLEDFTYDEALPLAKGLDLPEPDSAGVLRRVLYWTNGHPYLTQKVLEIISRQPKFYREKAEVDTLIQRCFLEAGDKSESNLRFVRSFIIDRSHDIERLRLLDEYRRILKGKSVKDEDDLDVKSHLKISGLVRVDRGRLVVRNRIYKKVFSYRWIQQSMAQFMPDRRPMILSGLAVASLVILFRSLGLFESIELWQYDFTLRQRPVEEPDPRILVVGIDEKDIQSREEYPIKEITTIELIQALNRYDPRAIALDFAMDFPQGTEAERAQLTELLANSDNIVAACVMSGETSPGVSPPPGIKDEMVGFADLPLDKDGVVRRSILVSLPTALPEEAIVRPHLCNQPDPRSPLFSLSLILADIYLSEEGIFAEQTDVGDIVWSNTAVPGLSEFSGGYAGTGAVDYQIMLNYRAAQDAVRQVSMTEILQDQVDPEWVRDRIVLIGYTTPAVKDILSTPYLETREGARGMYGVLVHAQATSQLISAVLDGRPLITSVPEIIEMLLILMSALLGICFVVVFRSNLGFAIAVVLSTVGNCVVSIVLFFFYGYWLPVFATSFVLVLSSLSASLLPKASKYLKSSNGA